MLNDFGKIKEQEQHKDDLTLKDLNQYYGTENYYNVMGVKVTDGIAYIMKNGYSWFVTDFLSLVITKHESIKDEEFLSIKLKLDGTKGLMEITDGNEKILYTQNYKYTNAKTELNLYFTNEVLLLSGEYWKMSISKVYLKEFGYNNIEDYFNYICDSYINGNFKQVKELFNRLSQEQKKRFYAFIHYIDFTQKIYEVLKW